jgi:hypothetical protein
MVIRSVTISIMLFVASSLARAETGTPEATVFGCSLGAKSVRVTAQGGQLMYRFGHPGTPELEFSADPKLSQVYFFHARWPQDRDFNGLRFPRGKYNYLVGTHGANGGGRGTYSYLAVADGKRLISFARCKQVEGFTEYLWNKGHLEITPDPEGDDFTGEWLKYQRDREAKPH